MEIMAQYNQVANISVSLLCTNKLLAYNTETQPVNRQHKKTEKNATLQQKRNARSIRWIAKHNDNKASQLIVLTEMMAKLTLTVFMFHI